MQYCINECQFLAFDGSSTTFEGLLNFSCNTNLLTFVHIGVNTGMQLQAIACIQIM